MQKERHMRIAFCAGTTLMTEKKNARAGGILFQVEPTWEKNTKSPSFPAKERFERSNKS